MTLEMTFTLHDSDLERFRALFEAARQQSKRIQPQVLLERAEKLVMSSLAGDLPQFVRQRLDGLTQLIEMVKDEAWSLPDDERNKIMQVLAYFVASDDVIADTTPVFGLVDDAIAAELILTALQHELEAYHEFSQFRAAETQRRANKGQPTDVSEEDWLADRRAALHSRMRERRMADAEGWHTLTLWGDD